MVVGIDFRSQRIYRSEREKSWSLDYAVPMKRISQRRIGGNAQRISAFISAGGEGTDRAAMLEVAQAPEQHHAGQREGGCDAAFWSACPRADFLVNQLEERRDNQTEEQEPEHDGLEDEDDIPGVPLLGKWPERANAVIVGEVEQNVAEPRQAGVEEKQSPVRREIGIL